MSTEIKIAFLIIWTLFISLISFCGGHDQAIRDIQGQVSKGNCIIKEDKLLCPQV